MNLLQPRISDLTGINFELCSVGAVWEPENNALWCKEMNSLIIHELMFRDSEFELSYLENGEWKHEVIFGVQALINQVTEMAITWKFCKRCGTIQAHEKATGKCKICKQ